MDTFAPGEIPSIKYLCSVEIIPDSLICLGPCTKGLVSQQSRERA